MFSHQGLITAFNRNHSYIHAHVDGLSHAQSVMQPPVAGHCVNWILGHIDSYRNNIHELLGLQPLSLAVNVRYDKDTPPALADSPDVMQIGELLAL